MECIGSLSSFDFIFEDFALVLVVEWCILLEELERVMAYLVDEVEGGIYDFIEVHRYDIITCDKLVQMCIQI